MWIRAHQIVVLTYALLPVVAAAMVLYRGRATPQERKKAIRKCVMLAGTSVVMGVAVAIIFGVSLGGKIPLGQILITCYFIAGLICLLKILDWCVNQFTQWVCGVGRGRRLAVERRILAMMLRVVLLFSIGFPYMAAAAFTYRPKALVKLDPGWQQLGAVPVQCTSTDGLNLAGLWIKAGNPPQNHARGDWGRNTVIVCHGLSGGKGSYLELAKELQAGGYNVLTFDFRGYGQSDGQMVSFGDRERCDVLGMVRWVKANYPDQCRKIQGVGIDTGGAALLAAAADPSPEGRALQSLAISGCYDRFDHMTVFVARIASAFAMDYLVPPLNWLMVHVGVNFASLQTGTDLANFSPADEAVAVAPRPIMFIHGKDDRIIPFSLGQNLFQTACAPKTSVWLDKVEDEAINAPLVAVAVRRFFDAAVPMI